MIKSNKKDNTLFLKVMFLMVLLAGSANAFLGGVDAVNNEAGRSLTSNISIWGKIGFGLIPMIVPIGAFFIVNKIVKKKYSEDDDAWLIYLWNTVGIIAGIFVGLIIAYGCGEWLLPKHGGGDAGLEVFSTFWAGVLGVS